MKMLFNLKTSVFITFFLLNVLITKAQITSTFDTDADGWTFFNSATSLPVNYQSTNGNPGGYISATFSSNTSVTVQSWFAPAKFLGNQVAFSLDKDLRFNLQQSQAGTSSNAYGDIRIESGSTAIVYAFPEKPAIAPDWTSYSVKLDETQGWLINTTTGVLASRSQIMQVLANITSIEIRGSYATDANYTIGLDNVIVEQRTLSPAPIITSFSPDSGNPGLTSVTISGSNFGPSVAENEVYFGTIRASITSATSVQIVAVVPVGATYGPITVLNKTDGGISRTEKPFNPTFTGGGRIIPSSFSPKVDITLSFGIEGLSVADVDGDGWSDLAVANNEANAIDIYRNLGLGGDIS